HSPPRRGGVVCATKKMPRSHQSGADGVVRPARPRFRRADHPVRSNLGGFAKSYWCRGHPSSARRGIFGCGFAALSLFLAVPAFAQNLASTAKAAAPADPTGYWVSVVTEDYRWRMFTPLKGDAASVPINDAGRKIVDAWDPAKDEAA